MSRVVAQIIPFISLSISLILVCRALNADLRQYTQLFLFTSILSTFLLTPILCVPLFGFLPYFALIERSHAVYWIYLNHAERSSSVASLLIMLSIGVFIAQYSLGCLVFSRILKLPFKTCVSVFYYTVISAIFITVCSGMVLFG
jgi:hypothetical protein